MTVDWALVVASTAGATTAARGRRWHATVGRRRLGRSALERGGAGQAAVGHRRRWCGCGRGRCLVGSVMASRAAAAISTAVG